MKNDIMDYVKGCADCQQHKVNLQPTKAPLRPIYPKLEATPFDTVAIDLITKLPESQGYDSILTITDHDCTKAAIFIPCNEEINAEGTAALYIKHVFIHFGLPSKIISNRDPRFVSKFTRELCRIVGIEQNISTAYHPWTDGQSERTNQWLETFLRFVTDYRQHDWVTHLPMAQFTHNNWPSDTTRKSPFFLLMGYDPRADWRNATSPLPQVTLRLEQLKEARDQAQMLMIKAQKSWVKHKDTPKYKEGDLVWLEGRNLRLSQPTPKLAPRRHGPFKVVQVMSPINYRLELPTQWSIHPVFHIDLLTPYRETITHGPNFQCPPPNLVDNKEEYEVKKILDSRQFGRCKRLQYLVKWKGYPDSDNMWVDKDDVFADNKVREFKTLNPDARVHIRHLWKNGIPQFLLASSSSSSTSYFAPHILSMSNVNTPARRSTPGVPGTRVPSPTASEVAEAFHLMSLGPLPESSFELAEAEDRRLRQYSLPITNPRITGDEDGEGMASGTIATVPFTVGGATPAANQGGVDSDDPDYQPDMRPCPRGCGPLEYCHGHTPSPSTTPPLPIQPRPAPAWRVVNVNLNRAEAAILVDRLSSLIQEDDENTTALPLPYAPQRVGIQQGTRGGRGRGRSIHSTPTVITHSPSPIGHRPTPHNKRRPSSPVPTGFEHNWGTAYIPFNITNRNGQEVLARYIQVHMNADDPYVLAWATLHGPIYGRQLHAAPVNDLDTPVEPLTDVAM